MLSSLASSFPPSPTRSRLTATMRPTATLVWIAVLLAAALLPAVAILVAPLVLLVAAAVPVRRVALQRRPERIGLALLLAAVSPTHLPRASLVA